MSVKPLSRSTPMNREPAFESSAQGTGSTIQRPDDSTIVVLNRQRTNKINRRRLKQMVQALLDELELERVEIGINLVGLVEMTRLNETFLRHAGATDVITFDYRFVVPPSGGSRRRAASATKSRLKPGQQTLHGEIFICVDEAVLQARRFGASWQSEIVRYLVHGVLHLLGYDDAQAGARRKMKREENRLLRRLGRRFSLAQLSGPANIPA
jgi:probable rRNA maturation factor